MIDNRSIVITLKLDKNSGTEDNDISNQTNTNTGKGDKDSQSKAIAMYAATQMASVATSEVLNWAEYYWNRELSLNDDYIGQRNKKIITTQINRGIGVISGIASSTMQGAMIGGVPGAIIGAIIGTTTQIAGIARSNIQGKDQQDIMLRQMNASLEFTRSRVGWSTQAASIGEDL